MMTHQSDGKSSEMRGSRRTALAALAIISTTLLAQVQTGPLTAVLMEDFLTQCTASITACWHLLNGDGLVTVEYALPSYLPLLVTLARQSSPHQKTAAHLAAQGSLLMYLVSHHRLRFREELAYANQAVTLAKVSGDCNLHVSALIWLAGALERDEQPKIMLQKCQEAAKYLDKVVPLLRSQVLACLAYAHALNGPVQGALRCMGTARDCFPSALGEVPCFVSCDYDLYYLILYEGRTHLSLGESDTEHARQHSQQARTALAQFGQLSPTIFVPERYRLQIINEQAAAAIGAGNMEEFEHYLLAGVAGAKALGSQKRHQEAIANWQAARKAWPHEETILKLASALIEP
jgi:tetratricopeptide (TPR) repeat protein